jgi:hypothetical protein
LNTYGYAYQNPLCCYDPTGEFGIAGAPGGIVSGYLLSKLTGRDYSLKDGLVDGDLGAAGAIRGAPSAGGEIGLSDCGCE